MKGKLRLSPSPALVISILALVLAASGTAVAASKLVSGNSLIKKDSLSGNRLQNGSVTGKQIAISSLGEVPSAAKAVTATSATTATTANTATTAGSAPITNVTYVTAPATIPLATSDGSPVVSATATCPSGTTVIGGGAQVSDEDYDVTNDSYPNGKTGWTADFYDASESGSPGTGTVTAICAPAAATTGS
jgi:hypothetical protein